MGVRAPNRTYNKKKINPNLLKFRDNFQMRESNSEKLDNSRAKEKVERNHDITDPVYSSCANKY